MPSPFPGMDLYLEGEMWQEFHDRLANQISEQLMPKLAPKYVALLAKRFAIDRPSLSISGPGDVVFYPDVHVTETKDNSASPQSSTDGGRGITVAEPAVEIAAFEEVPIQYVEVRDVAGRQLVTVIEILSPVNKRGEGAEEYADRRFELFKSRVHLLEIDLLRQGRRIPLLQQPPPADYYVYLRRGSRRPYTEVFPVALRDRLPVVPVPLLPPDPDVPLDLQAALDACFDVVGYERLLDYAAVPPPPDLPHEDAQWVREQINRWSLRPS